MKKIEFNRKHVIALITVITGIILDQVSKLMVVKYMTYGKTVTLIPYLFDFTYVTNRGMAFGMLSDKRWIFMTVSIIAIVALIIYSVFTLARSNMLYVFGISMIVSGGIGNMIDRIAMGHVIDFIEFAFVDFATFNVADSFVCIGAFVFAIAFIADIIKESDKT